MASSISPVRRPLPQRLGAYLRHGRLLLALKAALAAGIAWWVAQLVPGVASAYPYYAPLGALVCMYPTVAGSVRTGLQTLLGLGAGILLAFPVILLGNPTSVTVGLVVGLGVLLAALPRLGAGRDWIPMAALFVLLLGGDNADSYSLGYSIQMLVGVGVGLAVNALVFPPLHLNGVVQSLEELRSALALQLSDMGAALEEKWPPEHEEWASRQDRLSQLGRDARSAVQLADTSRRGNLRRHRNGRNLEADYHALGSLERITFYVEDITEVLSGAIWRTDTAAPLPAGLGAPLAEASRLTSEAIDAWDPAADAQDSAEAAVEALMDHVHRTAARNERIDAAATFGLGLRRILLTIRLDSAPAD
ncbi:FUSC family protein [Arthrobacter sp. TMN-37]